MRTLLASLLFLCVGNVVAQAEYQATPGTPFDLGELTAEFKKAVPNLEGCDDTRGLLTCRRLTGDFTAAEKSAMNAALLAHDPDIGTKRKTARQTSRQAAITKLKALGLTEAEIETLQ